MGDLLHQLGERLAVHVFHDEKDLAGLVHDVEGLHDVWVDDARGEANFVAEHLDELGLARQLLVHAFDRDDAREAARPEEPAEVHTGHAPHADLFAQHIAPAYHGRPRSPSVVERLAAGTTTRLRCLSPACFLDHHLAHLIAPLKLSCASRSIVSGQSGVGPGSSSGGNGRRRGACFFSGNSMKC